MLSFTCCFLLSTNLSPSLCPFSPFVHLVHYVVLICCYSFLSFSLPLSCTSLCCPYLYFSLFFPVLSFYLLINLPSLIFVSFLFFSLFLCCILFISLCCPYLLCLFSPFFLYINLHCPCLILSLSSQKVHYHHCALYLCTYYFQHHLCIMTCYVICVSLCNFLPCIFAFTYTYLCRKEDQQTSIRKKVIMKKIHIYPLNTPAGME